DEALGASFLQQSEKAGLHELLAADDPEAAELVFEFGLTPAQELLAILVQERYRIDFGQWEQVTARQLAQKWDERWHKVVVPQLLRDVAESEPARRVLDLLRENVSTNAVMRARCEALVEQIPRIVQGDEPERRLGEIRENARVQGGGTKKDWGSEDVYNDIRESLAALRGLIDKLLTQLEYDPEHLVRAAEVGMCALRVTARVGARYDERKAAEGLVDFDDLLLRTRNLLRDHPAVCRRVQSGIALLM